MPNTDLSATRPGREPFGGFSNGPPLKACMISGLQYFTEAMIERLLASLCIHLTCQMRLGSMCFTIRRSVDSSLNGAGRRESRR
jgi:hypothetical protein